MGRSRGTKNDRASHPAPGRGVWPSELEDLQRIGKMSPAWHARNHLVQDTLGEVSDIPPAPKHNPLTETADRNDYISFDTYVEYGILSESIACYVPEAPFTEDDRHQALRAVQKLEKLINRKIAYSSIRSQTDIDKDGLRKAQDILISLGGDAGNETLITNQLDPDGSYLSQKDSDHLYALAAYIETLLEGSSVSGLGQGMQETRREALADMVDQARSSVQAAS